MNAGMIEIAIPADLLRSVRNGLPRDHALSDTELVVEALERMVDHEPDLAPVRAALDQAADGDAWLTDDEVADRVKQAIAEAHAAQR